MIVSIFVVFKTKEHAHNASCRFAFALSVTSQCKCKAHSICLSLSQAHVPRKLHACISFAPLKTCCVFGCMFIWFTWNRGRVGAIKQYSLWGPLGRILELPGRGSSLRKQEPLTFPPNNKASSQDKRRRGWKGIENKTALPGLGKQVHPPQTISFLLLFVEFRNKTKQNNTHSSPWVGELQGCSVPQIKSCFSAHGKTKKRNTQWRNERKEEPQTTRQLGKLGQIKWKWPKGLPLGVMAVIVTTATRVNELQEVLFSWELQGCL